ncbi:MAG: hypothetical protein H6907_11330 [Hyphomicrobiales bacterium]|nr:hypothetical protein [Hyphomicrobiales bacterium]MCP5372313.1 hypothetical protein [Hyphomicrobiales bacterium]
MAALTIIPVVFAVVAHILRAHGGPFWMWTILDPSYYYLFDGLNLVNLTTPGQPFHPGTPVQVMVALVLKAAYPLQSARQIAETVLADPEAHLRLVSSAFIVLWALVMLAAGLFAHRRLGDIWSALLLQLGPFLSMVILMNAYHVKPEPVLMGLMLVLSMVVIAALEPQSLDRHRTRYAVLFGLLAGFGIATKLTVAPIFVLPLLLLGNLRAMVLYGVVSVLGFLLFTAPIWGAYDRLWGFAGKVMASSGAYAAADSGVIDLAAYPRAALKIASRPVVHVPILAALVVLALDRRRARAAGAGWSLEARALAGIALAMAVQVLAVAKQPTANYMVPAYMLAPLALVVMRRLVASWEWGSAPVRTWSARGFALFVCLLAVMQVFSVLRLDRDLTDRVRVAGTVDDDRFRACARIYVFPPSSHSFAMYRGDWESGLRHTALLRGLLPGNDYWLEQGTMDLRNAAGSQKLSDVLAAYPCLFIRGAHRGPITRYLQAHAPDLKVRGKCSTRDEAVLTANVDCRGRLLADRPSWQ